MANLLFEQIATFNEKIAGLDRDIRARAREQEEIKRLMTIPGVGLICAMAVNAFAPPMESFRRGRDFAAWIGLTPRQNSTAGKQRLGRITKMGQRDLRRLLILGATAVVTAIPLDVTDRNAVAQAADTIEAAIGALDLCVPQRRNKPALERDRAGCRRIRALVRR